MVKRSTTKQTTVGGVIFAVLVALYSYAQPIINDRFQLALPPLSGAGEHTAKPPTNRAEAASQVSAPVKPLDAANPMDGAATSPSAAEANANGSKPGPLAGRVPKPVPTPDKMAASAEPTVRSAETSGARSAAEAKETKPADDTSSLRYGVLKDLGGERYISPAGLLYTRGGAEGHRLDHLERHTVDDPARPGKHGVFDGGMSGALKTIDRAYERAKTGQKTTKEMDEGRVIYTVDMGGRVGYIGGQDGNRQKKPMARRVRIVLDQQRVITAYPL